MSTNITNYNILRWGELSSFQSKIIAKLRLCTKLDTFMCYSLKVQQCSKRF